MRRDVVVKPDLLPGQVEAICHGPLCRIRAVKGAQQRSHERRRNAACKAVGSMTTWGIPGTKGAGERGHHRGRSGSRLRAPSCWRRQMGRCRSRIGGTTTLVTNDPNRLKRTAAAPKAHTLRRCLSSVICAIMQGSRLAAPIVQPLWRSRRPCPITRAFVVQRDRAAGVGEPRSRARIRRHRRGSAPLPCDTVRADRICFAPTAACK
jgi:hypothetical protein